MTLEVSIDFLQLKYIKTTQRETENTTKFVRRPYQLAWEK